MWKKEGLDNPSFVSDEPQITIQEEEDIWQLPQLRVDFTPWAELTGAQKVKRVFLHYLLKFIILLASLYIFICSLSFLGDAFKLLGGKTAGQAFTNSEILSNPVAGLMIGVLATVLLQSSSTTTSIVVSMVGGGGLLSVKQAVPIIMGANIGTSVTNTIVALGQITDKSDFRRAFAGATVHDVFNWLTVIILLPVEVITGYLEHASKWIVDGVAPQTNEDAKQDYLKVITNPFTKLIIQVNKNAIKDIALGDEDYDEVDTIIKHYCCPKTNKNCTDRCNFIFEGITNPDQGDGRLSDTGMGAVLLVIALVLLCVCLVVIVKTLHSLLRGQIAHVIRKFINANFPGKVCGYFTGYLAILIGAGLTVLVQSSSIFTSSITPLVGMGVLSLDRMYPLTLGSNIGTTATGILAAFAQDGDKIHKSLQIALCHLLFNITGILIFFPFPFFRPPIAAAKFLGVQTAKYRWFAIVYLILGFFVMPAVGFGLSVWSWVALAVVFGPLLFIFFLVLLIKYIQGRKAEALPEKFRDWKWLPLPLRSLEPYDRLFMAISCHCMLCKKVGCCKAITDDQEGREEQYKVEKDDKLSMVSAGNGYPTKNGSCASNVAYVSETKPNNTKL